MSTFDEETHYYSGQGVVMTAFRDPTTGEPMGFEAHGNVSELTISIAETVDEHKESQSGQRLIDVRTTKETKGSISFKAENHTARSLARALRGTVTTVKPQTVTGRAVKIYPGKISAVDALNLSAVVAKIASQALTLYTNDATPWDYKLNAAAGSLKWNDGSLVGVSQMCTTTISGVTVGVTTSLTVTSTAAVGSLVMLSGFTGADAALLNNKLATVLTNTGTVITVDIDTAGKTITATTAKCCFEGQAATVDYTTSGFNQVDAMTEAAKEIWVRFEGLNTQDSNNPVVVNVFKVQLDPPKDIPMINEGIASYTVEGSALSDATRTTGSKFFSERLLR